MKIYIYLIVIIGVLVAGFWIGFEISGGLAGLLGVGMAGNEIKNQKKKEEEAVKKMKELEDSYEEMIERHDKKIKEAGDVDAEKFDNPDDAADFIDNFFNNSSK